MAIMTIAWLVASKRRRSTSSSRHTETEGLLSHNRSKSPPSKLRSWTDLVDVNKADLYGDEYEDPDHPDDEGAEEVPTKGVRGALRRVWYCVV